MWLKRYDKIKRKNNVKLINRSEKGRSKKSLQIRTCVGSIVSPVSSSRMAIREDRINRSRYVKQSVTILSARRKRERVEAREQEKWHRENSPRRETEASTSLDLLRPRSLDLFPSRLLRRSRERYRPVIAPITDKTASQRKKKTFVTYFSPSRFKRYHEFRLCNKAPMSLIVYLNDLPFVFSLQHKNLITS